MVLLLGTNQMKTMCMFGGEEEGSISVKNVEYVARSLVCWRSIFARIQMSVLIIAITATSPSKLKVEALLCVHFFPFPSALKHSSQIWLPIYWRSYLAVVLLSNVFQCLQSLLSACSDNHVFIWINCVASRGRLETEMEKEDLGVWWKLGLVLSKDRNTVLSPHWLFGHMKWAYFVLLLAHNKLLY